MWLFSSILLIACFGACITWLFTHNRKLRMENRRTRRFIDIVHDIIHDKTLTQDEQLKRIHQFLHTEKLQ